MGKGFLLPCCKDSLDYLSLSLLSFSPHQHLSWQSAPTSHRSSTIPAPQAPDPDISFDFYIPRMQSLATHLFVKIFGTSTKYSELLTSTPQLPPGPSHHLARIVGIASTALYLSWSPPHPTILLAYLMYLSLDVCLYL